jgi:TP901 family phage tail tape measure protein
MASPSTIINANLNINPASVKSAQTKVQSAFSNINLNPKSVSQFSNSLGRITGQATEFKKSMDAATARVFAFGATATVINGISQSFKTLVASTIDVEKRLIEINSIFGATEKQFASFRKSIFEVAKNTGQSFAVVADGAAELARQGLSAEETAKRLNASLILTRVSGLDAVSSVNSLTAALNGFTSAGLNAENVVNKIIAVDTAFAVSAKDLAEGFQRAGSTAEDAGVSFDELLGLITSVQQKTARGGAVIGNAFKSIFTRLSRGTTISELQELGVQIDASQSGVQKLQALSDALENVGNPTVASKIKELAGGVFQINVVSAALKDLSSETSIFADAASKSAAASNEAFSKNEALNKSLAAQINALVVGATNLAEKLGQLTLGPVIGDLTSLATKFTDFLNSALDEDSGSNLIKGFFQGISAFIQGPGIILVTGAFLNIFKIVAKFAKEGFQDLLKIGSGQEKIKSIEAGIVQLLTQDEALRDKIVSTTLTQAQKEQLVIDAIRRENALLREQQAILASLASGAARAGVVGFGAGKGFSGKKGKGFAVGGRVTGGSGTKDDVPAMLTAGEFVIRKSSVDKFGPAFMSRINEGVLPTGFARGGAVGAARNPLSTKSEKDLNRIISSPKSSARDIENAQLALASKRAAIPQPVSLNPSGHPLLLPSISEVAKVRAAEAAGGGFLKGTVRSRSGGAGTPFIFSSNIDAFSPKLKKGQADPFEARIEESVEEAILKAASDYAELLDPPFRSEGASKDKLRAGFNSGAIKAAAGTAFETAITTVLGMPNLKQTARFDIPKSAFNKELKELFSIQKQISKAGEIKISGSRDNLNSFAGKLLSLKGGAATARKPVAGGRAKKFAIGGGVTGGSGTKDDVPAMLTAGEFVIKKDSVNKFGTGFMSAINEGKLPVGFNKGGAVGGDQGGLGRGFLVGSLFSFATPLLNKGIEQFNSAADEVAALSEETQSLEEALERVNKKVEPEKFNQLESELAGLNKQLEEAKTSSADFSARTFDVTNAITTAGFALTAFEEPLTKGVKKLAPFTKALGSILNAPIGKKGKGRRGQKGGGSGIGRDLAVFTASDIAGQIAADKILNRGSKGAASKLPKAGRLGKIAGLAQTGFSSLKGLIPKRTAKSPLAGVSSSDLLRLRAKESSKFVKAGITDKASIASRSPRIQAINAQLAKTPKPIRDFVAPQGAGLIERAKVAAKNTKAGKAATRLGRTKFGKGARVAGRFAGVAGALAAPAFVAAEAVSSKKARDQRFEDDLLEMDPTKFLDGLEIMEREAGIIAEKINPFDKFSGPDGGIGKGLLELLDLPKVLVGIAEGAGLAAANLTMTDEEFRNMTSTVGVTDKVIDSFQSGALTGFNPALTRMEKDIEDSLSSISNIVTQSGFGRDLSIAFKSELDLLKQNVASGGLGASIQAQQTALDALQSSPLLDFASPEQRKEFATQNLKRSQRIEVSQEGLESSAAFNRAKGTIESNRLARIGALTTSNDANLSGVNAMVASSGKFALDKQIEGLNKTIEDAKKVLSDEGATEQEKERATKSAKKAEKAIKTAEKDKSALDQAAAINEQARIQANIAREIPQILRQASVDGDGQGVIDRFEAFQKRFLEEGGSEEDLKEVSKQLRSNLESSVNRQQAVFQKHITEMQATIAEDINSRLDANKVQQQFIKDLEQNFGKNIEDFEKFSDPATILSEIPELGDRSAMFDFLKGLDISDDAARKGSLATTSGSLASALALGSGDRLEDLVFGTGLDDKREDAAKKREALAQAQANLAAGTGTQQQVDDADAEVKAAQAEAQRIRQKAISERFTADEQALFDDINRRATSVNVDALQGQFTQSGQRFGVNALNQTLESRDEINTGADLIARIQELNQVQSGLSQANIDPSDKAANNALIEMAATVAAEKEALESALEAIRGTEGSDELIEQEKQLRQEGVTALEDLNEKYAKQSEVLAQLNTALETFKASLGGGGNKPDAAAGETGS